MQVKRLKTTIAWSWILIVSTLTAQEQQLARVKEFGIGLFSFNNFSLQYRWGTENKLFRFSGNIGTNSSTESRFDNLTYSFDSTSAQTSYTATSESYTPINLNCGISFSVLKMKTISDKFALMYGSSLGLSYSYTTSRTNAETPRSTTNGTQTINSVTDKSNTSLQPYVGIVAGVVYKINNSFLLYAEVSPNLFYAYSKSYTSKTDIYSSVSIKETSNQETTNATNNFGISNLTNSFAMLTIVYRISK